MIELKLFHELSVLKNKINLAQAILNDKEMQNREKVIKHLSDCFELSLKHQPREYDLDIEHNYVSGERLI
jgi:hypothetical protein